MSTTLLAQAIEKARGGVRIDADEALALYQHAPLPLLGELANAVRMRRHPERIVTYIIDRNVNYTNICVARCNFCAFYRAVGSSDGYVLGFDEIYRKIDETMAVGGNQLLLQGGHNPDLPLAWYEDLFRAVKTKFPDFKLHALSPPEVLHISRMSKLAPREVIDRLIAAGLDSIPGGGAVTTAWPRDDRMTMDIGAMGQSLRAYVDLEPGQVVLNVDLPPALAFVEPMIAGAIRSQGDKLLAPPET